MILSEEHGMRCSYGCCGTLPKQSRTGRRKSQTKDRIKRSLKKRDRRAGKVNAE